MAHRIDAGVQAMKSSRPETYFDSSPPHPKPGFQLPPRHHPVLPIGQLGDSIIDSTRLP